MKKRVKKITIESLALDTAKNFNAVNRDIEDLAAMTAREFTVVHNKIDDKIDSLRAEMKMEFVNARKQTQLDMQEMKSDILTTMDQKFGIVNTKLDFLISFIKDNHEPRIAKLETDVLELKAA